MEEWERFFKGLLGKVQWKVRKREEGLRGIKMRKKR